MKKTRTEIEKHYNEARRLALLEVEALARKTLRKHKTLKEFVMCMGRWFFTDRQGKIVYGTFSGAGALSDFIADWDEYLKLTGTPMSFTADGPIVRNW